MDICKYCKNFKICDVANMIGLVFKHILIFIKCVISSIKDNIIVNIATAILLILSIKIPIDSEVTKGLIQGALYSIFATVNLLYAGDSYRKEIVWDGDIKVINYKKYNSENKKSTYYSLCYELSRIIGMIITYFGRYYAWGVATGWNDYQRISQNFGLQRYEELHPDLDVIDENDSYERFKNYVNAFKGIEAAIFNLSVIQGYMNAVCPNIYVKNALSELIAEMQRTNYIVKELQIFLTASSVYHDANIWRQRLHNLLVLKNIGYNTPLNNVRNLVINLTVLYEDINKDYNFDKNNKRKV